MPFTNQSLIKFLILLLLLFSCTRFIYLTRVKEDTFATLPFLAFFLSILNIFVYGSGIQNFVLMILSLTVSLINVRAILRLASSLVIDHYGIPFILSSIICLGLVIYATVKVIEFTPYKADAEKYEVSVSLKNYEGSFAEGFTEVTFPLNSKTLLLHVVESKKNQQSQDSSKVILFVPPLTARFYNYEAFLYKLARDGWKVYCAEFYNEEMDFYRDIRDAKFVRPDYCSYLKLFSPEEYTRVVNIKKYNFLREYRELLKICGIKEEDKVVAITDEEGNIEEELSAEPLIDHAINLDSIDSYKTPGFGPVENTNFLIARHLGIKTDRGFFISNYLAQTVENLVQK